MYHILFIHSSRQVFLSLQVCPSFFLLLLIECSSLSHSTFPYFNFLIHWSLASKMISTSSWPFHSSDERIWIIQLNPLLPKKSWRSSFSKIESTASFYQGEHIFRGKQAYLLNGGEICHLGLWASSSVDSVAHYGNFLSSFLPRNWVIILQIPGYYNLHCNMRLHLMLANYGPRTEALMWELLPHKSEEVMYTRVQLWG